MRVASGLAAAGAALALSVSACGDGGGEGTEASRCDGDVPAPDGGYPYLFASTVFGKALVIDLATRDAVSRIDSGHLPTQGVGVLPGQGVLYCGNQDTPALERIRLSEDRTTWEVERTLALPGGFRRVVASRNGGVVAVGGHASAAPWEDRSVFVRVGEAADEVIGERTVELDLGGADPATWEPRTPNPRTGLAISFDEKTTWLTHDHNHTVTELSLSPFEERRTWSFEPVAGVRDDWLGPSAHLTLSPDGRWLAVPGYEGGRLVLLDTSDTDNRRSLDVPSGELVEQVAFSPDCRHAWVLTRDAPATLGLDGENSRIGSRVHVVELETLEIETSVDWSHTIIRIAIPTDSSYALVAGAYHGLIRYDLATFSYVDDVSLGGTIQPLIGLDW